ncbi:hypothetical protein [Falsiroseomonas bella]|uniref:hypothetical protein n=1 Tax=Falsiroseomonas bella TaxID=2184016 RepID=UPI001304B977|nr:hypothetical protein [Falsiroseomonas bella]
MFVIHNPIVLRHRHGAEWMRHVAGHALQRQRAEEARAAQDAAWRLLEAFIPCG